MSTIDLPTGSLYLTEDEEPIVWAVMEAAINPNRNPPRLVMLWGSEDDANEYVSQRSETNPDLFVEELTVRMETG